MEGVRFQGGPGRGTGFSSKGAGGGRRKGGRRAVVPRGAEVGQSSGETSRKAWETIASRLEAIAKGQLLCSVRSNALCS